MYVWYLSDSCGVTERNSNSISSDVTDETIKNDLERHLFQLFSDNLAGVLDFFILHNICTLSLNIKLICTRYETG